MTRALFGTSKPYLNTTIASDDFLNYVEIANPSHRIDVNDATRNLVVQRIGEAFAVPEAKQTSCRIISTELEKSIYSNSKSVNEYKASCVKLRNLVMDPRCALFREKLLSLEIDPSTFCSLDDSVFYEESKNKSVLVDFGDYSHTHSTLPLTNVPSEPLRKTEESFSIDRMRVRRPPREMMLPEVPEDDLHDMIEQETQFLCEEIAVLQDLREFICTKETQTKPQTTTMDLISIPDVKQPQPSLDPLSVLFGQTQTQTQTQSLPSTQTKVNSKELDEAKQKLKTVADQLEIITNTLKDIHSAQRQVEWRLRVNKRVRTQSEVSEQKKIDSKISSLETAAKGPRSQYTPFSYSASTTTTQSNSSSSSESLMGSFAMLFN